MNLFNCETFNFKPNISISVKTLELILMIPSRCGAMFKGISLDEYSITSLADFGNFEVK
ncbi:unnamed protein product [Moneuplotes crassus]|uniref:Uncharacterized protein n=1 Tax=Euplotes crassus TaxID=5936 RepID=A0AAD1UMP9_EUPCR|nr:unnamed protein product [Moneuplotes crassus]